MIMKNNETRLCQFPYVGPNCNVTMAFRLGLSYNILAWSMVTLGGIFMLITVYHLIHIKRQSQYGIIFRVYVFAFVASAFLILRGIDPFGYRHYISLLVEEAASSCLTSSLFSIAFIGLTYWISLIECGQVASKLPFIIECTLHVLTWTLLLLFRILGVLSVNSKSTLAFWHRCRLYTILVIEILCSVICFVYGFQVYSHLRKHSMPKNGRKSSYRGKIRHKKTDIRVAKIVAIVQIFFLFACIWQIISISSLNFEHDTSDYGIWETCATLDECKVPPTMLNILQIIGITIALWIFQVPKTSNAEENIVVTSSV